MDEVMGVENAVGLGFLLPSDWCPLGGEVPLVRLDLVAREHGLTQNWNSGSLILRTSARSSISTFEKWP
jgi:hypothetical protein